MKTGFVLAAMLLPLAQWVAQGQTPPGLKRAPSASPARIRSIRQLNLLSPQEAARRLPVHLLGAVTYSDPEWGLLFLEDSAGAAYVDAHGKNIDLPQGTRVQVDAITIPGDVNAAIGEPVITVMGRVSLPEPKSASLAELEASGLDSRWVETAGVLRPAYKYDAYRIAFRIWDGATSALVIIPRRDDDFVERMVDAKARVRGVCGVQLERGKRIGVQIFVSRPEDILVEDPASASASVDPYGIAATPAAFLPLLDMTGRFLHRVRVTGAVIYRSPRLLLVQQRASTVPVIPWHDSRIGLGELANVVGFPSSTEYGTGLVDAVVRPLAPGGPPNRLVPQWAHAAAGKEIDGRLVQMRAQLIEEAEYGPWRALTLADGGVRFTALLPRSDSRQGLLNLRRDSTLEISGVAMMVRGAAPGRPASLVVLVNEGSVLPLSGQLIWKYVLVTAGAIALLAGGALVWITLLRRTVRRQVATIRDRLEREAQLESQYQRLFERNLAAVFRWRPDGEILDCNAAFARILGFPAREQLIGRSYWDFELGASSREQRLHTLAGEAISNRDATLRRLDGEIVCLLENITPVETEAGRLYETTAIDVTQLRRNEEDLRRARDAAEAASRCKSEFLANMSHEIRTPLNGIIGMLELGLAGRANCADAVHRDYLTTARSSAGILAAVINDILDFSRIEAGRLELERVPFRLRECIGTALRALSVEAHRKRLEMICAFAPDVPDGVIGDPVRFVQVVNNLVCNAIKFTERGEVALEVSAATLDDGWVAIAASVRDTGVGIDLDKQARIFDSFVQADTSTTRRYGGSGLGLTISARLVELMGGRLHVSSEPGAGSTFSFTVRLELAPGPTAETGARPAPGSGKQVLLVDDNPCARRAVGAMLAGWGAAVTQAATGPQALEAVGCAGSQGIRYDAYLLDQQMPEMDGLELAERLRKAGVPGHRIVILTSTANGGLGDLAASRRIAGHVPKPVLESDLSAMLERVSAGGRETLPPAADRNECEPPAGEPMPQVEPLRPALPRRRVLLAEDNPVNQKVAVRLLERLGCLVHTAGDGREAVEKWSQDRYDVVFMDVQMPGLDGFGAVHLIREAESKAADSRPRTPVVALTAHALAEDRERCLKAGMDLYVSKPVSLASLAAALEQAGSFES